MKAVQINNVSKAYFTSEGKKTALENITFSLDEGSLSVIGGENGSGKSVLMNIISGLEKPDCGSVITSGRTGLVFQEADTQILGETVEEDISFGPDNLNFSKEKKESAIENALETTALSAKRNYPARFLSGGEKRRLAVAGIIAMDNSIIIFDEPYANLDFGGVKQVNSLIKKLKEQKKTVIILTHELEKCLALADNFIVLFRGKKVFEGKPSDAIKENLEQWNIKNPLARYEKIEDMVW